MRIAIIGMGLIGGSLARSIKLNTDHEVYASDIDPEALRQAELMEAIDGELTDEVLAACEIVLVATRPRVIVEWIAAHADRIAPGALVIDCGGVKRWIVERVQPIAEGKPWRFIGGHPMAGREYSGFRYSRDNLFERASMILTPRGDEDLQQMQDLQRAKEFFLDIGFRRVVFTTPARHDEMIAYTSQLAHVVSGAYVNSPLASKHKGFSAGSFADMTRVARVGEELWSELFLENRDDLLPALETLIGNLSAYRDALAAGDEDALKRVIRRGREMKESLDEA